MRIPRVLPLAAAAVVLAACSAAPRATPNAQVAPGYLALADPAVTAGGTLDVQMTVDNGAATGLDPQLAEVATSWQIMSLVYETLVTVGPDFSIQPQLATSWDTPDPTTYVFHLRDGVTFSNGRAMTADDVVGSFERLLGSQSIWRAQIGPVRQVSKVDDRTVEVKLSAPYEPFLASLANVPAAILPMQEIRNGSLDLATTMLGTGPFVVESHRQDVSWRFTRREGYWAAGKPSVDTVNITIAAQEQARMAALQNGSADLVTLGNVDSPRLVQGLPGAAVATQATTDFYYLMLNGNAPGGKFADPRVRQAITIAMDRDTIATTALGGFGKPTGVTPAGLPGACDPARLPSATSNLDQAKQLLQDAGAENLAFQLTIFNTEPAPAIAQVIQQNLARIGITVTIEQLDEGSWSGKVYGAAPATFDAAMSWFAGYADAGMAAKWWNPEQAGFNAGFMKPDPALNAKIDQAIATSGPQRRSALQDLCAAVDTDAQMIPLVTRPALVGYRKDALSPTVYATEGYGNVLRGISDFRLLTK
ncbi:ABC transporter substrate-binding protein [Amycolatopsis endophytica]|uniref:Peptide/nickel transport system substrate-binding protein n=1 Tax=Amycolatopsis endophytica TaxID=860233 RepID=A0A853AWT4_9PSEU|nr:ABC transporter substrate-binding protein [Amycolatopsis endophytica]NYI87193.1 peptide/nickel transport system substrate-binding protein [Amycolatopsis endophytica]